jgi:hypothetical protein
MKSRKIESQINGEKRLRESRCSNTGKMKEIRGEGNYLLNSE